MLKVTFKSYSKVLNKSFEIKETHSSIDNVSLRAMALNWQIVNVEEVKEKSDNHLTIWQKLENGYWVQVRTRPAETAKRLVKEYNELKMESDRYYNCFPININPNQLPA